MKTLFKYLDKIPKTIVPVIGVISVILLGVLDYLSGYEMAFSMFYLLPVVFVSWFDKRNHALLISILSAVTWMSADISAGNVYSHPLILVWNTTMRLGFFLLAVFAFSEIKKLLGVEQTFARTDFLTDIANSRAFYELAKIEIDRSVRFRRPFTIAYIDIDDFKQINDTLGHSKGDNLLQSIAKTIKDNTRSMDIVSRLGGDEFAILFPETNETNAKSAITKVQQSLLSFVKNNNWPVTFSIGTVTCYESCILDELIKEADTLMYSVKESGKNRIEYKIYSPQKC
ncbi:MAG: GGDEF domain-containing protein [Syntrophaceae bacterium]|nr:GGDEF domain-containing protein [Syntrophaceae bacterium]